MPNYYNPSPYNPDIYKHLNYSKASPEKKYIRILKYIYDNPNSKKVDAVMDVFKDMPPIQRAWLSDNPATKLRGYAVTYFGQLVNDGLIVNEGKGRNVRFTITNRGIGLLKKCGVIYKNEFTPDSEGNIN